MGIGALTCLVVILGCARAAPVNEVNSNGAAASPDWPGQDDLKADASTSFARQYSNWGGGYPGGGGYSSYVTGYGLLDDKYTPYNSGVGGYDRGYNGYNGYSGYAGGSYGSGYGGNKGYGGYDANSYNGAGYGPSSIGGNGGYGGFGGNGGLNSYYGYNNPQYQGANHLGYGYQSKLGHGSIYYSGVTPSLVTGYRGYSRR